MELMYRAAVPEDLDAVFRLVTDAITQMERQNIRQWDSIYPAKADFQKDIVNRQLFVGCLNGVPAVVYALNRECDGQYRNGRWRYTGDDYIVVHRLCVAPERQNQGLAHAALLHIEQAVKRRGCKAVRLDVFSENPYACRLYASLGYYTAGTAFWRKGKFYLLEKLL